MKFDVEFYEDYSFDDVSVETVTADSEDEAVTQIQDRFPNGYVRAVVDLAKFPADVDVPF